MYLEPLEAQAILQKESFLVFGKADTFGNFLITFNAEVDMYNGKTKLILKYLGFLTEEYGFCFRFQSFDDYNGFCGPIDTYSFYNQHGCFTLHHVVQKGEWRWFRSREFSTNQYNLLEKELNPNLYISNHHWLYRTVLKQMAASIKRQTLTTGTVFGIKTKG